MKDSSELMSIIRLFICTDRLHKSYVDRHLSKLGIHRSQHIILMRLAGNPDNMSQKELAENLNISPAAVAVSLKKLESEGYIKRLSDKQDGRFNRLIITEKGIKTVEESKRFFYAVDRAMCSGLTDDELDTLKIYLEKMNIGLKSLEGKEQIL